MSPSIYVKFFFTEMPAVMKEAGQAAGMGDAKSGVVIWTTTPWTLPANAGGMRLPDCRIRGCHR